MEIKILYDNCKELLELDQDWGFSALIETGRHCILFDTGNNQDMFFSNLEKMQIDLGRVTDVVFSHRHSDHITGCQEVLQRLQKNTRVYLPKGFPLKKIPQKHVQAQTVKDLLEIGEGIFCMPLKGGIFLREQSLILKAAEGLVVVTGCAHPGIVHIIETAKKKLGQQVYLALGGFHLFRKGANSISEIVRQTQSLQVKKVAPCHCSGELAIRRFQEIYGENFYKVGAGTTIKI